MINLDKFTTKAREALSESHNIASSLGHPSLTEEHLTLALATQNDGVVSALLEQLGVGRNALEGGVRELLGKAPQVAGATSGPEPSYSLQRILKSASETAARFSDEFISSEHLFMAVVQTPGRLGPLFRYHGIVTQRPLSSLKLVRGSQRVSDPDPEGKYQALPLTVSQRSNGSGREEADREVIAELRRHFRPEFLNRIDEIVRFNPLTREALERIVEIQLSRVERSLGERKLTLSITPHAREYLARIGYDADFGARPLKRAIQRAILDPLSVAILSGRFKPGQRVSVDPDAAGQDLVFEGA